MEVQECCGIDEVPRNALASIDEDMCEVKMKEQDSIWLLCMRWIYYMLGFYGSQL